MGLPVQGFVAGLGTQEDGEPMKLRTTAIVPDKSRLPAVFDVQGEQKQDHHLPQKPNACASPVLIKAGARLQVWLTLWLHCSLAPACEVDIVPVCSATCTLANVPTASAGHAPKFNCGILQHVSQCHPEHVPS